MEATSLQFAEAARALAQAARARGLVPPAFRSPPRIEGAERTVRRQRQGGTTVAIRIRQRPWSAVLADMIEGVVVANRVRGAPADQLRNALWEAVEPPGRAAA